MIRHGHVIWEFKSLFSQL